MFIFPVLPHQPCAGVCGGRMDGSRELILPGQVILQCRCS